MLKTVHFPRLSYSPWTTVKHSTYPLFKGEVRRGAPCVLTGQQPVGVSGAGRVGVGGGVGAGWTHGWRHVAVVVQHGAVTRVRRRGLRGGRVGPTQQRSGSPIHRLVRPDETHRSEFTSTAYDQRRVCVCVCLCVQCCTNLLPLLLAGASAIQVQRERSWSSWAWWSTVKAASVRSSTCRHTEICSSADRELLFSCLQRFCRFHQDFLNRQLPDSWSLFHHIICCYECKCKNRDFFKPTEINVYFVCIIWSWFF